MFAPFSKRFVQRSLVITSVLVVTACSVGADREDVGVGSSALSWTDWTTDGAPPAECPDGSLVTGARCQGRYCDDVALRCNSNGFHHGASSWTDEFSEEDNHERICPGDGLVTGLGCSGRYCDDLKLRCTEPVGLKRGTNCYWSAPLSEEDSGTYEFPKGMYMAGARCDGRYCDNISFYLCDVPGATPTPPPADPAALAATYAPRLRFDQEFGSGSGKDSKCFPSDAAAYFAARKTGADPIDLCNKSYQTIDAGAVPTYYTVEQKCGSNIAIIRYWFFYSWQSACATVPIFNIKIGHHDADWESVAVKVVDGKLDQVAFFQHGGWYTKKWGSFEVVDGTHPVSYVGKNAHGDFHDSGGRGGCLYFDDFRNPGDPDMHMDTWRNLVLLHRDATAPDWMTCTGDGCFDDVGHPIEQQGDLCAFNGCNKDGCSRSDVGGKIPFTATPEDTGARRAASAAATPPRPQDSCAGREDGIYCSELVPYSALECKNGQIAVGHQCPTGKTCAGPNGPGELTCK
jgi:hypothetical protein